MGERMGEKRNGKKEGDESTEFLELGMGGMGERWREVREKKKEKEGAKYLI